jgi:hypothetical protein
MRFNAGYSQTAGKLFLAGGTFFSPATAIVAGGSIEGTGTVNANIQMSGVVSPGALIGSLTFSQNLTMQSGGSLAIELGGTSAGLTHDLLNVAGSLQVAGLLQIEFTGGFESFVTGANVFTIVNGASAITGSFSNAVNNGRVLTADSLGTFLVHYGAGSSYAPDDLVLSNYIPYIPGDFDFDGDVDGADFAIWANNFSTSNGANVSTGDADGDGDVDGADFIAWQTYFPTLPSPGIAPVPEPTGWILAIFSLAATLGMVRRIRHP